MIKVQRPKSYWLGLATFSYSIFLFCQGILSATYYLYIYPIILNVFGFSPKELAWLYLMSDFTKALVLITPTLGGIILMLVGYWLMSKWQKLKVMWASAIVLFYSVILLIQTIWVLFGYPHFSSELNRYLTSNIFINYPRFFIVLGAVIPPLVGSILFMFIGLYIWKYNAKGNRLASENNGIPQN
jgi:hypothetical protein